MALTQMAMVRIVTKQTRQFLMRFLEVAVQRGIIGQDDLDDILKVCELDESWLNSKLFQCEPDMPFHLLLGFDGHGPDDIQERLALAEKRAEGSEPENDLQESFWPGQETG